jgi:hypothetical protein
MGLYNNTKSKAGEPGIFLKQLDFRSGLQTGALTYIRRLDSGFKPSLGLAFDDLSERRPPSTENERATVGIAKMILLCLQEKSG